MSSCMTPEEWIEEIIRQTYATHNSLSASERAAVWDDIARDWKKRSPVCYGLKRGVYSGTIPINTTGETSED